MIDLKRDRILEASFEVFQKHGFKRVSMNEIAEAVGISRPGLYLFFSSKEEIFNSAIIYRCQKKAERIKAQIEGLKTTEDKIMHVFEIWTIDHFNETLKSQEAKEMSDSARNFARGALNQGYQLLEDIVAAIIKSHFKTAKARKVLTAEKTAYLLVSALRGFKLVAADEVGLRKMTRDSLKLALS